MLDGDAPRTVIMNNFLEFLLLLSRIHQNRDKKHTNTLSDDRHGNPPATYARTININLENITV